MWLKKELELQDWSRDRRRSGWDWLQGKGWQRARETERRDCWSLLLGEMKGKG